MGLILFLGRGLANPLSDSFTTLHFGDHSLDLTLELAVFASWAFLIDSPHLWATISRTYLDPDEWNQRRPELLLSLFWFIAGPIAVLGPYLAGTVVSLHPETMALGGQLFFAFFRLWAYYHVVRQHWGFVVLYKRKNGDFSDPAENRADYWFFNLSLYLPVLVFLSAPWQPHKQSADIDLPLDFIETSGITEVLYPLCLVLFAVTALGYVAFQWARWRQGIPRNGPKLLLLTSIVPLHFAVFLSPLLVLFAVPIVTVGHNLQYHRIVWMYGRNKYAQDETGRYRWARPIFRHLGLYVLLGVVFTFGFSRGPWIDFVGGHIALYFDQWIFRSIGLMAGITDPATAGVGAEVAALFLTGWSMHHYYLDAKIWRVSRDAAVVKSLNV